MSHKGLSSITIVGPLLATIAIIAGLSSFLSVEPWQLSPLTSPLISPLKLVADRDESGLTTVTTVGDTITYTLVLTTSSASPVTTVLTDTVDNTLAQLIAGSATASSGSVAVTANTLVWSGTVSTTQPVNITFSVALSTILPPPAQSLVNVATVLQQGGGISVTNPVTTTLTAYNVYLPIVVKPARVYLPIVFRQPAYSVYLPIALR
ncbi:MAG: hypothetical protein ACUVR3_12495 [Candidatus Roseilinea sp.]|uniref:hypothetical protein n=1 Tax=Candidatus Roseilinea sp. TaxID=2838777 RepID=UPI00404A20A8